MIRYDNSGLRYYQFGSLNNPRFFHAIYSRLGGTSPDPWRSLNIGGTVGDKQELVDKNLSKIIGSTGGIIEDLVQIRQIHSKKVIVAESGMDGVYDGDAIITNKPGLILLMRFADCVPIMIFDPVKNVAGIAHAGWKGTAQEVSLATVREMEKTFGSNPSDLIAGIGPSIGPDHYLVGEDVIEQFRESFDLALNKLFLESPDGIKLNLWKANQLSLQKAGVEKIEISNICTGCRTDEWFSHRVEEGQTGRFGAVVSLRL